MVLFVVYVISCCLVVFLIWLPVLEMIALHVDVSLHCYSCEHAILILFVLFFNLIIIQCINNSPPPLPSVLAGDGVPALPLVPGSGTVVEQDHIIRFVYWCILGN